MAMQAAEVQELLEAIEVGHIKSSGGEGGRTSFQIRGVGCKMHVPKTCVYAGLLYINQQKGLIFLKVFLTNFE